MKNDVIVIGAGIIGISIALELQKRGFAVRVLDRAGVGNKTSAGNAGAFAFAEITPLATPGIMRKAPKWLLDPLGPLSVPPSYALKIAPWMLRFWRASWPDRYQAALAAQAKLNIFSKDAQERQIDAFGGEPFMQRDGQLQLYEGEQEFRASLKGWNERRHYGVKYNLLESPEAIAEIQPGLDRRFTHAGFTPDWMNTIDPQSWTKHLGQGFKTRGGKIEHAEVLKLVHSGDDVSLDTPRGPVQASKVVIAAGAWSHHLARTIGDHIPLETERGYNTTLPAGAFDLRTQLTFGGHGFVASRINGGVRIGGAVELGGLNLPPNFKRAEILLEKAAQFLPDLNIDHGKQWMGFRPSMPDSLPVIGASRRASNVIYAFGHGHLGLTQSAGTAELVADLISGKTTAVSIAPFAPTRF